MTPMWRVFKRSWLGWSWERRKLWPAWKSWGSKSETWKSTGRWAATWLFDEHIIFVGLSFLFFFFSKCKTWWKVDWLYSLLLASLGTHRWSLEGQPQEEHVEWAAGRADEREAAWGRGPGRAARDTAEDAGDGDTGQSSSQLSDHINLIQLIYSLLCAAFSDSSSSLSS